MSESEQIVCPERDVIKRLRKQVGFSWPALAKGVGDFECNVRALEERTRPMKADERALMVKLLNFMLYSRFDYPGDMKAWRKKHGMTMRQACDFAGVALNSWLKIEHGKCRRWPYASTKARIDRLLDS